MKNIIITETITAYELNELQPTAKQNAILTHQQFLNDLQQNEPHPEKITESETIENIAVNEYLFNEIGELLPIIYHTHKSDGQTKIYKTTYKNLECKIENSIITQD
jgi:hypothetical protein